jgi:hypothetical protein
MRSRYRTQRRRKTQRRQRTQRQRTQRHRTRQRINRRKGTRGRRKSRALRGGTRSPFKKLYEKLVTVTMEVGDDDSLGVSFGPSPSRTLTFPVSFSGETFMSEYQVPINVVIGSEITLKAPAAEVKKAAKQQVTGPIYIAWEIVPPGKMKAAAKAAAIHDAIRDKKDHTKNPMAVAVAEGGGTSRYLTQEGRSNWSNAVRLAKATPTSGERSTMTRVGSSTATFPTGKGMAGAPSPAVGRPSGFEAGDDFRTRMKKKKERKMAREGVGPWSQGGYHGEARGLTPEEHMKEAETAIAMKY